MTDSQIFVLLFALAAVSFGIALGALFFFRWFDE